MIENDHQLQVTRDSIAKLKRTLREIDNGFWSHYDPLIAKAQRDGVVSVIEEMEEEAREYKKKRYDLAK